MKQLTAQELRDYIKYQAGQYRLYGRRPAPEWVNKPMVSLQAILRLVEDVERWKKMMRIGPPEGGMWRVSEEIQGYKYGAKEE